MNGNNKNLTDKMHIVEGLTIDKIQSLGRFTTHKT